MLTSGDAERSSEDRRREGRSAPFSKHPTGPKVELHVHLEGTTTPAFVLATARRLGVELPVVDEDGLRALYRYTGFREFLHAWWTTTSVLRDAEALADVAAAYAAQASRQGVVYAEAVVSPPERVHHGRTTWAVEWEGWAEGCRRARDEHGVDLRLTVDLYRGLPADVAMGAARECVTAAERGVPVVGLGLGGDEGGGPLGAVVDAFALARSSGLGVVPHAGETRGPESVRETLDLLAPDRLRHGVTAAEDPVLLAELADRGVGCDVCPTSNLRLGVVQSLADHPLPAMVDAGVRCSLGSDDPAFFDTDLETEHRVAAGLGVPAMRLYDDAVAGALCDEETRQRLAALSAATDWGTVQAALVARLQRDQRYQHEDVVLTELARRGDRVYPDLGPEHLRYFVLD